MSYEIAMYLTGLFTGLALGASITWWVMKLLELRNESKKK
jgi:hypothetical protein